jgi:hypothetical protein
VYIAAGVKQDELPSDREALDDWLLKPIGKAAQSDAAILRQLGVF